MQAQDTNAALESALASEDFEEAAALQSEHDTLTQQAAALEAAHGFSHADEASAEAGGSFSDMGRASRSAMSPSLQDPITPINIQLLT